MMASDKPYNYLVLNHLTEIKEKKNTALLHNNTVVRIMTKSFCSRAQMVKEPKYYVQYLHFDI